MNAIWKIEIETVG